MSSEIPSSCHVHVSFPGQVTVLGSNIMVTPTEPISSDYDNFEAIVIYNSGGVVVVKGHDKIHVLRHDHGILIYDRSLFKGQSEEPRSVEVNFDDSNNSMMMRCYAGESCQK